MASRDFESYGQLGILSENIHRLLSEKECSIFDRGLADYHRRRNVKTLVECLSLVLSTGQKRRLLLPIRDAYVKPSDLSKFNQLVQAHGLATSHRQKVSAEEKSDGVRKLEIKRDSDGQWGFSIRGGSEHGIGIFISWIEPGSSAEKAGLQIGDKILKANDTSWDRINHYDAVMMVKNSKKLRLFVLAHGRVPGSRMAHKVYHWVDPEGRPASPPPDPFEVQDNSRSGQYTLNEADERKVTVIIDKGKELGISIRGGIEHGLGIYISTVEADSVAESYGLKPGDQILEVNGISFLGVVHADAANALRAQSCMVMKIKDVGKLPYSRITAYSNTKWYPAGTNNQENVQKTSPTSIFRTGVGSQVMLGQQQDNLLRGHGLLKDVAQSVLTEQELTMFMYYLNQYQQYDLPVNEFLPPILTLLDTPEKLQLLTELRGLIKPQDIQQYNEITVHKEIMAKKTQTQTTPRKGGNSTDEEYPQKLSPQTLSPQQFHIPPPPTSRPPETGKVLGEDTWDGETELNYSLSPHDTSTLEARVRSETETRLKNEFLEKEKRMIEEQQHLLEEERADKQATLHRERAKMEEEMKEREEHFKAETEDKMRREIERETSEQLSEKERELEEERERRMQEEREKEEQISSMQENMREQLEEKIWKEAEEQIREEYDLKRQQEREASLQRKSKVSEKAAAWDVEGRIRRDLENRIRREYEEKLRSELDSLKRQEVKEKQRRESEIQSKIKVVQLEAEEQARIEIEEKIRSETEAKVRAEYEERLQHETEERARLAEEVQVRKAAEERLQRDRIEMEREREKERKDIEREREEDRKKREKEIANLEREKEDLKRQVNDEPDGDQSEDSEGFPVQEDSASSIPNYSLEQQRLQRLNEEKEEERIREQEKKAAEMELKQQENERKKKKELQRKREENIRKRELERQQKEKREAALQNTNEENSSNPRITPETTATSSQIVKVNFGDDESASLKRRKVKKAKAETIENERQKADQKLQRRLKRAQEKKKNEPKSFGGFTDLEGDILHINVSKVVKKLGIAIDGGANTKQKAVIIREISPEGCAAQTGMGMAVNQQILQVNGNSLFGLKHREVVMEIKNAFDGPMNKVIEFVVLDPQGN